MPIYEYKCEQCHEVFEVLQKFSDKPLTECILCSKGPVKKLISVSSFVLKGAGFYVNDYGKKGATSEKKREDPSSSDTASTETTKSSADTTKSSTDTTKSSTDTTKSSTDTTKNS